MRSGMSKFTHMLLAVLLLIISLSKVAAETLSTGEDVRDYVLRKITEADVMVFAKSYCPHCNAARTLLDELNEDGENGWSLDVVDLDLMDEDDGPTIQMELLKQTHQRTVPNIFVNGNHIGGNWDLQDLYESGELETLLGGLVEL